MGAVAPAMTAATIPAARCPVAAQTDNFQSVSDNDLKPETRNQKPETRTAFGSRRVWKNIHSRGFHSRGCYGFWFLVSGFWFLVSGFWFLTRRERRPSIRYIVIRRPLCR